MIKRSGFTVIEILVVITVLIILFTLTSAGYSAFSKRSELVQSGNTLKSALRDAQARAFSSEIDCSKCDCSNNIQSSLNGWTVDLIQKTIYASCRSKDSPYPQITASWQQINIMDNIKITPYLNPVSDAVIFKRKTGVIAENTGNICLLNIHNPGNFYEIKVESGRIFSDEKLSASCPSI